MHNNNNNRNTN